MTPPPAAVVSVGTEGLVPAAPALPDLWPPVKVRRGITGFLRRHPTVAIGGALLIIMMLIAVLGRIRCRAHSQMPSRIGW